MKRPACQTVTTETTTDEGTVTTTEVLYYTYDASGLPMSVTYTDATGAETIYYYATNLQGDVTAILNTSGSAVVEYTYDAWGNPLAVTGTLADTLGITNSLRYRGYVYDNETGYYYLQSRYYNPELGRFINADAYASTGQGLLGNNMFAYCSNNPVNFSDPTGYVLKPLFEKIDDAFQEYRNRLRSILEQLQSIVDALNNPSEIEKSYAATVYAEAAGQNKLTKQAVAHVMNNRIGTQSSWTDIEAVISAPYQFSGYNSPMYQDAMSYYNTGVWDNPIEKAAMDECMSVVIPIFNGWQSDITGGALYFHSFSNPGDWAYHSYYTQIYIPGTECFWFYK